MRKTLLTQDKKVVKLMKCEGAGRNLYDFQCRILWSSWLARLRSAHSGSRTHFTTWNVHSEFCIRNQIREAFPSSDMNSRIEIMIFDGSKIKFNENLENWEFHEILPLVTTHVL